MMSVPASRGDRAEVERLHEQFQESLHALVTSEDWQQALAVAARFHDYSFANTRLIWAQATARGFTPSRVAGYRTWQKLGRQVRRGEKGIQILAPVTRTVETEEGEEEWPLTRRLVGFRVVRVFDQSQTDGEPLPEVRPVVLEGELPAHWERVTELITSAGFSLQMADVDRLREANGVTDWQNRQVMVRESLPGAQRFKTGVHELAHIRLHEPTSQARPNCRGIVEVEAESVAYMVCAGLGVDSGGYSLPYVATWSGGDLEKVSATAERVIRCARQILPQLQPEQGLARDLGSSETITTHEPQPATTGERLPDVAQGAPTEDRTEELEEALRLAISFYHKRLDHKDSGQARRFLQERGFGDHSVSGWQLGYAPAGWDTLVNHLRRHGIPDEILLKAGLAGRARTGRLYDRMRGRVVFPVFDADGSPRGFAGRLLAGNGPKYLNTPETPLYKKSELVYGLHHATPAITETGQVVIVEGYTDAVACHQAGLTNTVATGGTSLTPQHIEALRHVTARLTLAFDADQGGLQAVQRVSELPKSVLSGLSLQVADLPDGHDPASLIANGMVKDLREAVTRATPLLHHLIDRILEQYNLDEPEGLVRALHAAAPRVTHLTGPTDRARAVAHLAKRVERSQEMVATALHSYTRIRRREQERIAGRTLS